MQIQTSSAAKLWFAVGVALVIAATVAIADRATDSGVLFILPLVTFSLSAVGGVLVGYAAAFVFSAEGRNRQTAIVLACGLTGFVVPVLAFGVSMPDTNALRLTLSMLPSGFGAIVVAFVVIEAVGAVCQRIRLQSL